MDLIIYILGLFSPRDFGEYICFFTIAWLGVFLGKLIFKGKYYFLNFNFPAQSEEYSSRSHRWWSGLLTGITLLAQIAILLFFIAPLLSGAFSVFFAEVYYLQNPIVSFGPVDLPLNPGQYDIGWGVLNSVLGLFLWRRAVADTPKSSWLYSAIMKADTAVFLLLGTASLIMALLAFFPSGQFAALCFSISLISALACAAFLVWNFYHPFSKETDLYLPQPDPGSPPMEMEHDDADHVEIYPEDWKFRFSKLKDPSKPGDQTKIPHSEEIKPELPAKGNRKKRSGTGYRFSELPEPEEDWEKKE